MRTSLGGPPSARANGGAFAADRRLGYPYPSEFAKHPGSVQGVDLMLLAALFAGWVSAAWAYHLAALAALTVNGWIAAWIVLKFTRSTLWAAVAVALITLNESVAARVSYTFTSSNSAGCCWPSGRSWHS